MIMGVNGVLRHAMLSMYTFRIVSIRGFEIQWTPWLFLLLIYTWMSSSLMYCNCPDSAYVEICGNLSSFHSPVHVLFLFLSSCSFECCLRLDSFWKLSLSIFDMCFQYSLFLFTHYLLFCLSCVLFCLFAFTAQFYFGYRTDTDFQGVLFSYRTDTDFPGALFL